MDLAVTAPGARRLRAAARQARRAIGPELPPVLVFTDPRRSAHPLDLARAMPRGWGLVYRHFGAPDRFEIAAELAKKARISGFSLLIGADPHLAKWAGADGVHWPEAMWRGALKCAHAFAINTMSAHRPSSVLGPQPAGIHARILSTVFPSKSPSAGEAMGAVRFRHCVQRSRLPVYGLGGVNADTAHRIASVSGLAGVGVLAA